jgi:hypothetical protein
MIKLEALRPWPSAVYNRIDRFFFSPKVNDVVVLRIKRFLLKDKFRLVFVTGYAAMSEHNDEYYRVCDINTGDFFNATKNELAVANPDDIVKVKNNLYKWNNIL